MKDVNPNRRKDETQEQIITDFLLRYYFSKAFLNIKLITDTQTQSTGVDVTCDSKFAKNMRIDVKAQSSAKYINNPRPTFSLEVSTYNRYGTNVFTGWFFNANSITEYYTFVWIHRASVDTKGRVHSAENIERIEVLTVDACKLKDYINNVLCNYGLNNVEQVARDMRNAKKTRIEICNGIHYSHSPNLIEKPVNLVVHKRILKKFTIPGQFGHCIVTKDDIRPIRNKRPA
jgi:hypothetical protein